MVEKKISITSATGVDTRLAALFVQIANKFAATPWIVKEDVEVNGKSIMGIISLAMAQGDEVMLKVEGPDENEAAEQLEKLLS